VIATTNCQDITELGGLGGRMPATTSAYLIAGAGLTGLLPLGCFWCFGLATDVLVQQAPLFAAVFLTTNALMAWNLTRVYRQVFLGPPQPKTKRAPEVNWQMALPMVALSVVVVLTPALLIKLNPVPGINAFSPAVAAAVIGSSAAGVLVACLLPVHKSYARSLLKPVRLLQDLLAFDFYTDRFYRLTIVNLVSGMARLTNWFDQAVVNGFVNRLGRFSLVSADGLKLSVSGQTQTYVLTALMAVVLLLASLNWVFG
jgi:NAD(P)H-quinone oxidoreductase subunit 5